VDKYPLFHLSEYFFLIIIINHSKAATIPYLCQ